MIRPHWVTPEPEEVLALFRRTDPPTSQAAAARVPQIRGDHSRRILEALSAGPAGQTEIAARAGMTVAQVSKRMHELRKDQLIERTGRVVGGGECEYRRCG